MKFALHHVSVIATDVERTGAFYEGVLGFKRIQRPPFSTSGLWYALGALQVHIVVHPGGTFRQRGPNTAGVHFALRADDFDAALAMLESKGFRTDLADDHPKKLLVRRGGAAGFPQVFLLDPDRNIIEINQAPR